MTHSQQLAKHLKEVFSGGNWTASNLKDQIGDVTYEEAIKKIPSLNTIATLVQHITYYVPVILAVLKGGKLNAKDELSFDYAQIDSQSDWENFLDKKWSEIDELVEALNKHPDEQLFENFTDEKYGSYYRNLLGLIEHSHYHLGQIALIKKLIKSSNTN